MVFARFGVKKSQIDSIVGNLYCATYYSCSNSVISNIDGNLYSVGLWDSNITNVSGEIIGLNSYGLRNLTIRNASKVLCLDKRTCDSSTIKSVPFIVHGPNAEDALEKVTIVSDLANDDNSDSNRTMTVEIYGENIGWHGSTNIYCSFGDTCKIGCFHENACRTVDVYCYGTCLVDCDGIYHRCPRIRYGTYDVWYSNGINNDSNSMTGNIIIDSNNSQTQTYDLIFLIFIIITSCIGLLIIVFICGKHCTTALSMKRKYVFNLTNLIKYICSGQFMIFFLLFCYCVFLAIICCLYGFGQITQITLTNYWCQSKTIDEIKQHSIDNNLTYGTNEGCWKSKQFTVDQSTIFQSSTGYAAIPDYSAFNIVASCIWLIYSVWFIWMAIVFFTGEMAYNITNKICCLKNSTSIAVNTKKNMTSKTSKTNKQSSFHRCCPFVCCRCMPHNNGVLEWLADLYFQCINWYKLHFGPDSTNWFVLLLVRELMEIIVQIIAIYNFNGLNLLNSNETVLGYKQVPIVIFCVLLGLNCVLLAIVWLFYVFFHKYMCCHGEMFKNIIFFLDLLFDTFYALFPIIIVASESKNGFNSRLAVAALQNANLYVCMCMFLSILFEFGH